MSNDQYNPVLARKNRTDLFSTEECKEILANLLTDKNEHGHLVNFDVVPATEHVGFLGEYFHLYLRYQLENQKDVQTSRLFVKSVIFQNANMEFYMEKMGLIKKESKLYELLNDLKKFCKFEFLVCCLISLYLSYNSSPCLVCQKLFHPQRSVCNAKCRGHGLCGPTFRNSLFK